MRRVVAYLWHLDSTFSSCRSAMSTNDTCGRAHRCSNYVCRLSLCQPVCLYIYIYICRASEHPWNYVEISMWFQGNLAVCFSPCRASNHPWNHIEISMHFQCSIAVCISFSVALLIIFDRYRQRYCVENTLKFQAENVPFLSLFSHENTLKFQAKNVPFLSLFL